MEAHDISQLPAPENGVVSIKPASGGVTAVAVVSRGFAVNDPRHHQGCSDIKGEVVSGHLFVTQDPIGLAGGLNNYRYVPNPTSWIDPLGLSCKEGDAKDHQLVVGAYSESKTGHAVVAVIEPDGTETMAGMTMKNYYGQKSDLLKAVKGSDGEIHGGSLAQVKESYPGFSTVSTPITKQQAQQAMDKIYEYDDKLSAGDMKYKLLSNQCATFACDVSKAAGVTPPKAGLITNPKSLHKSINKINLNGQ